jgi:hypothetical protein
MARRQNRTIGSVVLVVLGTILLAIAVVQGALVAVAHALLPSPWAEWVYWSALLASVLMAVPPGVAGYIVSHRSGRLSAGMRAGLTVGVLGGGSSALLAIILRIVQPDVWQKFVYISGPPPGPLASPLLVGIIYFAVTLFYAWLGTRMGVQVALAQHRKRRRETGQQS